MKRLQLTREHEAVVQNSRMASRTASAGDPAGKSSKVKQYSAGAPAVRLSLDRAGAADGTYLNPPIGTVLEADGPEWILKVEVSFDLQPFQGLQQPPQGEHGP